jgi:hypothetical protein
MAWRDASFWLVLVGWQLHKQQFIELVRARDRMGAIQYASEHLSKLAAVPEHVSEIQVAMATLAFEGPEACPLPEYAALFAPERWEALARLFAQESRRCHGLNQHAPLEVCLQAGLCALKTPVCLEDHDDQRNANCPVCSTVLVSGLPHALLPTLIHVRLVCLCFV